MISIFHLDDGHLIMSHYCAGNQLWMKATLLEDTGISFDFLHLSLAKTPGMPQSPNSRAHPVLEEHTRLGITLSTG